MTNKTLEDAGVPYRIEYAPAYEWQAINMINAPGTKRYCASIEMGTSRVCKAALDCRVESLLRQHERGQL